MNSKNTKHLKSDQKIIFHVDVNSAFLSWEAVHRLQKGEQLDLRTVPSVIGGDAESRRGIVLAKSGPAKKYGISTGEPLVDALRKCPHLVVARGNYDLYMKSSFAMFELLKEYSEHVDVYSIDECFMDVTDMKLLYLDPVVLAEVIKEDIKNKLGFTVSIGISSNMLLAKMASDLKKPNAITTLFPSEISKKMWHLPISDLFMVGRKTAEKLNKIGIQTIGELAKSDPTYISRYLMSHGRTVWSYANGIAEVPVTEPREQVKSIGNSTTVSFDVDNESDALLTLLSLTESVCERLREHNLVAKTVSIFYKTTDFVVNEHQGGVYSPTDNTMEIFAKVETLFRELWKQEIIRALGVRVSQLQPAYGGQIDILDRFGDQKNRKLDFAIDELREDHQIKRASFIESGIDERNAPEVPFDELLFF